MPMIPATFPRVLQTAVTMLPDFVANLKYARDGCIRAMRPERREAVTKLLEAMLCSCSLQHSGGIMAINATSARPKTLEELALQAGISFFRAREAMRDLRVLGIVRSRQIRRRNQDTGQLEVSPGLRVLTEKFWQALGLLQMFRSSVAWAKKNCSRRLNIPFKVITRKAKAVASAASEHVKSAGEVLSGLLPKMSADQSTRIKHHANRILAMIRQRE